MHHQMMMMMMMMMMTTTTMMMIDYDTISPLLSVMSSGEIGRILAVFQASSFLQYARPLSFYQEDLATPVFFSGLLTVSPLLTPRFPSLQITSSATDSLSSFFQVNSCVHHPPQAILHLNSTSSLND
jgi:hypothetical protein